VLIRTWVFFSVCVSALCVLQVNMIVEFEATQEYLGQARHVAHLPSQWSTYFSFDTYLRNTSNTTLAEVVSGRLKRNQTSPRFSGTAAVSNFGDDPSWTGHPFSAANSYGYGRLAWAPLASVETITHEWVDATFGPDHSTPLAATASTAPSRADPGNGRPNAVIADILLQSWEAYENYTSSLGWTFACNMNHYEMDPVTRNTIFINATRTTIGINRGTELGYGGTYNSEAGARFTDVAQCPEENLLFFHSVPYTHQLKGPKYGGLTGESLSHSHALSLSLSLTPLARPSPVLE
jgi:alpha-glucuronidase